MSSFAIEKVKWEWAAPVQNKQVYRDDEFVRTKTKEEALDAIDFLMGKPQGLTYTITVLRDGEYLTYWRHSMPCLGGLVKYRDSHGDRYFMNPFFPRDIRVAFPEGEITYISCAYGGKASLDCPYMQFILSEESPWVSAFGSKDTIIFKERHFVLTNMNADPTVLYSIMRLGRFNANMSSIKCNPKAYILATTYVSSDPRRIAGQKPMRISGGTWAEGFGYTRPYNESIFKTTLPHAVADFGKLAGYPQASHTNTYYVTEMKNVFGLDVNTINYTTMPENIEKTLVEAWAYFKEKSKELSDEPTKTKKAVTSIYKVNSAPKEVAKAEPAKGVMKIEYA